MRARRFFRRLGQAAAIAGLAGVGLCGLALLLGAAAAWLPQALTGAAVLAGAGAFTFLNASGGGDPDTLGGGSSFDSGGGDSGDTSGDSGDGGGGDGGGE